MNPVKVLLTVSAMFLFSGTAVAEKEVRFFGVQTKIKAPGIKSQKADIQVCQNFTGLYSGRCDSESQDRQLQITQVGCEGIAIDSDSYTIGAVETRAVGAANYNTSVSQNVNWNENAQKLLLSYLGHVGFGPEGLTLPLLSHGEMSLSGGILNIIGQTWGEQYSCTFVR